MAEPVTTLLTRADIERLRRSFTFPNGDPKLCHGTTVLLLLDVIEDLARDVIVANECIGSDAQAVRRARSLLANRGYPIGS